MRESDSDTAYRSKLNLYSQAWGLEPIPDSMETRAAFKERRFHLPIVEVLREPDRRKPSKASSRIELVSNSAGWSYCFSAQTRYAGWGYGPIVTFCTPHPTREVALRECVAKLREWVGKMEDPEGKRLLSWLNSVDPDLVTSQMNLC